MMENARVNINSMHTYNNKQYHL